MNSKRNRLVLTGTLLSVALLAAITPAFAEVDSVVREAKALLDKSQAKQAFDLLEPLESKRAGDPDFDTLLGIAANETNQYTRAIFALERVLSVQPENSRARAELGRALFAVGDTQGSRRVLMETKQGNIPAEAAASIDQFLQAIDRTEQAARSSVRGYVEAGIGSDSNINSGPGSSNVAVPAFGGLIFTLNNAGVKTSDGYATLAGGVNGRYVLAPRWSLIGGISANARANFKNSTFNTQQIDANAGVNYRYDQHEFSGALQVGTFDVNGTAARNQYGLVGEWTYRVDGNRQWSSYLQLGQLKYPGQPVRDASRTVLGTSYAHSFRNGVIAYGGGYIGEENQNNGTFPQFGHRLIGFRGGLQKEISQNLAFFAAAGFEDRSYKGPDPLFLVTRHDQQSTLNLGVNWIVGKFWRVSPQITYLSVKSNIAISDYNRTTAFVNLRRDF